MKIGFFEESEGIRSMARLLTFIFAIYAIFASGYTLIILKDYAGCIAVFSAISAIAVTVKLVQKQMETKPQP